MKLVTEVGHEKQKVLIVDKENSPLTHHLKTLLESYDVEVFFSSIMPARPGNFDYLLLINLKHTVLATLNHFRKRCVLIYTHTIGEAHKATKFIKARNLQNAKVVHLAHDTSPRELLEKVIWFALSSSSEPFLNLSQGTVSPRSKSKSALSYVAPLITPRLVGILLIVFVVALHLVMLPILVVPTLFLHRSYKALAANDLTGAQGYLQTGKAMHRVGHAMYPFVRPTYSFLSLALLPDTIDAANGQTVALLEKSTRAMQTSHAITVLLFKKNKTPGEKLRLTSQLNSLTQDLKNIEDESSALLAKLPDSPTALKKFKQDMYTQKQFLHQLNQVTPHLPQILAKGTNRKYLLLFANNMELRPGGGFIGSFGVMDVADMTIADIKIYDVYDADGQLTEHVDPPAPIREHLDQPNWFLRDSAFSPDFTDTFDQAQIFLSKELQLSDFSGGIMITTTAIQQLLEAFGTIYLPDFKEHINKDNFYLKAQYYAEHDFFPGSIQKKSFLGSLSRYLLLSLEQADLHIAAQALKKSLEEKQIVLAFSNQTIQNSIDGIYWGGRLIPPTCPQKNCVANYIFPLDANLGVNKANFYVTRLIRQKTEIRKDGRIVNSVFVTVKNASPSTAFPGGPYKNYFQLMLPPDSLVNKVTQNGKAVADYDEQIGDYKSVGFLTTIPPRSTIEIQVDYVLFQKLTKDKSRYQLIVQKQIGAPSSDFVLEMSLPSNLVLSQSNFSPIVKGSRIFYNTSLSSDKIFVVEFEKH